MPPRTTDPTLSTASGQTRFFPTTRALTRDFLNDFVMTTTSKPRRSFNGYDSPLDLSTYGVPLAFTVVVLVIMCMVIAYTKAQRRRQRQRRGPENNLRSISGGVPMNVAAFRNYGLHLASQANGGAPSGSDGYYPDYPPPYEVAIQTPPPASQPYPPTGVPSVQPPQPPAYSESVEVPAPAVPGAGPAQPAPLNPDQPHVSAGTSGDSGDKNEKHKDSEQLPEVNSDLRRVAPKPEDGGSGDTDNCATTMTLDETQVTPASVPSHTDPISNISSC